MNIFSSAQSDSLQRQINQQVWKPFLESFGNLNTEAFMSVHSKQVTRVIQDGNRIFGFDAYHNHTKQANEAASKANQKRILELRFIQRIASNDQAFEVGYYKYTGFKTDGTPQYGYGKFHVLLRRENGTWKILMDADASEKTDETIFRSAKAMEE